MPETEGGTKRASPLHPPCGWAAHYLHSCAGVLLVNRSRSHSVAFTPALEEASERIAEALANQLALLLDELDGDAAEKVRRQRVARTQRCVGEVSTGNGL